MSGLGSEGSSSSGDAAPWAMSLAAADALDDGPAFEVSRSPVWLLGIAAVLVAAGIVVLAFWGFPGAIGAYLCALGAFAAMLAFRRADTVLRQTSFVAAPSVLRVAMPVLTAATVLLMVAAVWPIATEISRGV